MKGLNERMNNKRSILFRLTEEEFSRLERRAQECNMSVNQYAKQLALDETDSVKLRKGAAMTMASLYYWAEEVIDPIGRKCLKRGGDMLCQSLK